MSLVLSLVIGILIGSSVWLMLGRDIVRFLFGLVLISNAANLILFVSGGLDHANPPLIPEESSLTIETMANALPQALILTAIVIGFGLLTFALVLVYRVYQEMGTVNTDQMRFAEPSDKSKKRVP